MLGKLLFHRLAGDAGGDHRVGLVAEHADDLGGHCPVEKLDGELRVAAIVVGDCPLLQVLACLLPDIRDVCGKRTLLGHWELLSWKLPARSSRGAARLTPAEVQLTPETQRTVQPRRRRFRPALRRPSGDYPARCHGLPGTS